MRGSDRRTIAARSLLLATAVAVGACGSEQRDVTWQEGQRAPGGPSATGSLDDAQIAALIALINGTEAASAKAVEPKLAMPAVRAYAAALLADHTRLMQAMPALEGPRVTPRQATTLNAVFHSQAAMMNTLPAGYPFDAAFVAVQITDHVMAIDSLFRWRESAENPELRGAIDAAIPVMRSHLEHARRLYAELDQQAPRPGADTVPTDTARRSAG